MFTVDALMDADTDSLLNYIHYDISITIPWSGLLTKGYIGVCIHTACMST